MRSHTPPPATGPRGKEFFAQLLRQTLLKEEEELIHGSSSNVQPLSSEATGHSPQPVSLAESVVESPSAGSHKFTWNPGAQLLVSAK